MRHRFLLGTVWIVAAASGISAAVLAAAPLTPVAGTVTSTKSGMTGTTPITASIKHALVIGNGAYVTRPLQNTRSDADLMAQVLRKAGYDVTLVKDLNKAGFLESMRNYATRLPVGGTSVVYYAGHGMQLAGSNYLIPVDMVPTGEASVAQKAYPLKFLHERLAESRSAVNIIILDACRNNPFEPTAPRMRAQSGLGLARVATPRGTIIAYSTAPGQLAEDGAGRQHSLYTETLANMIARRGMPIEEVFKNVADQVRQKSLEDQQPWFESSLIGTFTFDASPGDPALAKNVRTDPTTQARTSRSSRSFALPGSIGHEGSMAWYRTMNEYEWTTLDNDMHLRAMNATEDQIPGLQKLAAKGNVVAMTTLGSIERLGKKTTINTFNGHRLRSDPNMTRAIKWYRKAADMGFPIAQTELAEMLYRGRETDANKPEALRLFQLAAQANYPRAKIDVAQINLEKSGSYADVLALQEILMKSTGALMNQVPSIHIPKTTP